MELQTKIIEHDEAYLRQISKPVDFSKNDWQEAVEKLSTFCSNSDLCLAMASVQLGIPLRLIYLKKTDLNRLKDDYNESKILINPKIIKSEGLTRYWEACASCLNYTGLVERPYKIVVEYYDIDGNKHEETFENFAATVISHELDHLDGILHLDVAIKVVNMPVEERRILREKEPYKIIKKDGPYKRVLPKNE
ncbi:MAG: peptide deformylase [Ruminococcus sp.]|nr:peptide deformylase [Ruminococcus sp.]